MYGAFDVVLYFVIIQLFWLLINLLLILSYLKIMPNSDFLTNTLEVPVSGDIYNWHMLVYVLTQLHLFHKKSN